MIPDIALTGKAYALGEIYQPYLEGEGWGNASQENNVTFRLMSPQF